MSSITTFYGDHAALYDRIATAPGVGRWRRLAAEHVATAGDTVVEMGCGTGANLPYLRERVGPNGRVHGVDITGPLLERARDRTAEYDNVAVVRGNATEPPIAGADAVLATFVCGLFEDPATVVDQWCDLVAPGGRVGLLDATASDRPLGRPLNPLFRVFTAASSPTTGYRDVLIAPFSSIDDMLSDRIEAARGALTDRTDNRIYEEAGVGFVGLLCGRVV